MNSPTTRVIRSTVNRLRTRIQILGPLRVAATLGLLAASAIGLAYGATEPTTTRDTSPGTDTGNGGFDSSDQALSDFTPLQEALRPDEAAVATSPSLLPPQISIGDRVLILAGYLGEDPLAEPTAPDTASPDTASPDTVGSDTVGSDTVGSQTTPGRVIGVDPAAVTLAVSLTDLAEVAGPLVDGAATVVVVSAGG